MVVSDGMRAVEGVWLDVFFIDFLNRLARARNEDLPADTAHTDLLNK